MDDTPQLRMRTLDELKRHFVYNLPPNHKQFICVSCNAVYFSLCSYQAHKRTHLNSRAESRGAPYTCAECGLQQPTAKALTSHLLNHRWAPTILNAWRCEKCFTFYSNSNTLVVHFASHCQSYFKCPACPTAFQGVQSFEEHRRMMHPEIKEPVQPEPAPKCLRCEGIYLNKDQLVEHLKTHLNSMSPFKVFRCPICGRLMENKSGLLTHYWRSHRVEMKSEEVLEIPVQLDELKQTSMASSSQFVKIAPKLQRGEQTQSQPQPQCPSGSDGTTEFRYKTGGITFPTRCSRCPPEAKNNRIFTNLTMLQMHMTARHRGEMGGGAAGKDNPVVTSSSVNPIGSVSAGTLHHRPAATTSPKGVNQQQAAMKGGLACKKYGCFFVAATKHEMRGHAAAEHRDSQNYLCLECGLSCVTEGSLRRHLTIAHQIVDPVQYIKEYEDCLPLMYNKKVGNNNASSCYKCTVCGENFHTESELNIHSRSHGMLFLQQRSAQQSGK